MSLETLSETPTSTADPPQNENPLPQPSKRSIRLARRREWKARFDPVVPPSGPPLPQYVPMPELQLACPLSYNTEIQSFIDHPTFAATEVNYPRIEAIRCLLEDLVLRCVPSATGVALFGSACSTVMTPNSDLDFSIVLKTPTDSPSEILRLVRDEMRKGGPFTQDDYIPSARKPVTKCHIFHQVWNADQVDATAQDAPILFDIAVDHYLGVMNSQLIRTYCECDPRVRPFLLLIKKWTKAYNVADASMSRLASYSWSLTGLCFLQMVEPPIVPNLQSETYITASDQSLVEDHEYEDGIVRFSKDTAPWHSRQPNLLPNPSDPLQTTSPRPHNPSSVASLFVSYIDYMCHHYTNLHCMSVKHGGLVVTESIKHLLEETERPPRFVILDPFQKKRNPGVSVGRTSFIKTPLEETVAKIKSGISFVELISPPR
ncbi:hypothetical protein BLNAU_14771 [Blattamonas nauphoetae]|uniref:Poly(A) RNA polymerase mitochondrial-like central palm domain-containing protein n=1 Tax=Blattamonas nauphoetae TaxID=2049346 RepID=A0ABQ9XFS9_9EUKA|nr:hypothetical protein BLNAU_14771 [Blattamonas nauphoetae]